MAEKNVPRTKVKTQEKSVSINPVVALLIPVVILALVAMAAAMIWDPATFYTHSRQLQFMGGLGLLWLLCQFVKERGQE